MKQSFSLKLSHFVDAQLGIFFFRYYYRITIYKFYKFSKIECVIAKFVCKYVNVYPKSIFFRFFFFLVDVVFVIELEIGSNEGSHKR